MTDDDNPAGGKAAWKQLGMTGLEIMRESNLNIKMHEGDFEDFLLDPDEPGMKYLDSMCVAAYIEEQAHDDGKLPEFENSTLHVYPDRIEYERVDSGVAG